MASISDLMAALQTAIDAQHEYNKAHDEYDGWSWDWRGDWQDGLDAARQQFEAALQEYIDERVAVALANAAT